MSVFQRAITQYALTLAAVTMVTSTLATCTGMLGVSSMVTTIMVVMYV